MHRPVKLAHSAISATGPPLVCKRKAQAQVCSPSSSSVSIFILQKLIYLQVKCLYATSRPAVHLSGKTNPALVC